MPGPGEKPAGVGELPSGAGAGPSGPGSEPARPGSEPALRSSELVRLPAATGPAGPATGLVLPARRPTLPGAEPVFVLCAGWSGSTLLRSLLDAHPELACPPETRLATMCAQLAGVWSQLEGGPLPAGRAGVPPAIPAAALAGIRHTMDQMITPYLQRQGKRRYCDKSLGAAEHADVLRAVFPGAKFLCLYRHPMDVIASGLEACPWGLDGPGSRPSGDRSPRKTVQALARFWAANVALILAVEEGFGDCSHRVRYEDLVADPEKASEAIFRFVGVPSAPGLLEAWFTERERADPSDYKIWRASRISSGSGGRGWPIPAAMIGPPLTETINAMADKLGYARIDAQRGAAAAVPDPRRPGDGPVVTRRPGDGPVVTQRPADGGRQAAARAAGDGPAAARAARGSGQAPSGLRLVVAHLLSGLTALDDRFTQRWEPCSLETFLVTVISGTGDVVARWRVDLRTRTVTSADGLPPGEAAGAVWEIVGPIDPWMRVVEGEMSLSVALRRRLLRYGDTGDPTLTMLNRIAMLGDLLGVTTGQRVRPPRPRQERQPGRGSPRPGPDRAAPAGNVPRPGRPGGPGHLNSPGQPTGPARPAAPPRPGYPAPAAAARSPAALPMGLMADPGMTITFDLAGPGGTANTAARQHGRANPGHRAAPGPEPDLAEYSDQ